MAASKIAVGPTDRTVFQNAWVVDDIEAACMTWVDKFGVGPFFVSEYRDLFDEVWYRGERAPLDMFVGIAQAGPVQIELIQPLVDQCAYRDTVPAGRTGFHHMCVWTHDIDADTAYFESIGAPAANRGRFGTTEFAYYDTSDLIGCMLEVVTQHDDIVERFAEIAAAAENWDGKDPIRA